MSRLVSIVAAAAVLACSSKGADPTDRRIGEESFLSASPRGGPAAADGPAAGAPTSGEAASAREVVEADLYARDGTLLYVQNAWRGLEVVDLADPAHPRLRGRVPLSGVPVGLYLVGHTALVVSSDHLEWIAAEGGVRADYGSRLWAVDVSDPDAPAVTAEVPLAGAVSDTRLVGDVLYAVSRSGGSWVIGVPVAVGAADGVAASSVPASDVATVASFRVSDPAHPAPVAKLELEAIGWTTHANVTSARITVAQTGYGALGPATRLTAVDISDPAGALALGAEVTLAGLVRDRWALDLDAASGTFRAVLDPGWNQGARVEVLDWAEPGAATARGALAIEIPESVTAARFDGTRAYVVTAERVDPLWVVDLSDPSAPKLAGQHLVMPGQLDFIAPRGDRLLALGHTNEAGGVFQLHVSLLDVTDPGQPALVARETFGPDWGFVPASPDDVHKVFQILDDEGLVLVPFEGFDRASWSWSGGTQLLAFGRDALALRGFVPSAGAVRRAFAAGAPGLLAAFSDEALQTIDASDPASPRVLGRVDLARPVYAIAVVGGRALEVSGQPWTGSGELVVTPADDPDAPVPLWRSPFAAYSVRLFRVGGIAWALATEPAAGGGAFVQAVDLSDPAGPRLRGRVQVPAPASGGWWWSPNAALAGSALAVERSAYAWDGASYSSRSDLVVVDLSDPDAPRLAATVALPSRAWTSGISSVGTSVWWSQWDWWSAQPGFVRYEVGRVDLADPSRPRVFPPVNVPGELFSASDDGRTVYTEEVAWDASGAPRTSLHALALTDHGTARLLATAELAGWNGGALRAGGFAYASRWAADGTGRLTAVALEGMIAAGEVAVGPGGAWPLGAGGGKLFLAAYWPSSAVLVLDLADPAHPALESTARTGGWASEVVVEGGFAYLACGPYGATRVALRP